MDDYQSKVLTYDVMYFYLLFQQPRKRIFLN